jgi:hypothetical protein
MLKQWPLQNLSKQDNFTKTANSIAWMVTAVFSSQIHVPITTEMKENGHANWIIP